jgi:hypothetical protein
MVASSGFSDHLDITQDVPVMIPADYSILSD